MLATVLYWFEVLQTWSFRGSKSRNKVSVGEPAEGSLIHVELHFIAILCITITPQPRGALWPFTRLAVYQYVLQSLTLSYITYKLPPIYT